MMREKMYGEYKGYTLMDAIASVSDADMCLVMQYGLCTPWLRDCDRENNLDWEGSTDDIDWERITLDEMMLDTDIAAAVSNVEDRNDTAEYSGGYRYPEVDAPDWMRASLGGYITIYVPIV